MNDFDTGGETPELSTKLDDAGAEAAPAVRLEDSDGANTGAPAESTEADASPIGLGRPKTPDGYNFGPGESVYKVIELVGSSSDSWEKAAAAAVERAGKTLRDLRVAKVVEQDLQIEDGVVAAYRVRLKVSFKFEGDV